jgi:signal transduction histidine kinase
VYRVVQEALTNVFRHSGAREARVELAQTNGHLTISVRDDGKGIPKRLTEFKPGSVGVGIGGMRQRVSELGGKLKLENTNPGTLVQVVIPNMPAEKGEQVASGIST